MAMNVNNNINKISPMKTMRWAKPKGETSEAPDAPGKEP